MTLLEFAKSKDFRDNTCYFVSSFGLGDSYYLSRPPNLVFTSITPITVSLKIITKSPCLKQGG